MTPPKFTESVMTPLPVSPMLGQLSVVSATHTAPTLPPNLRNVPQAMHNVMLSVVGSSVVVPGAAVSTAACTAPSYLVPVATTQLPVKPPAGTMPTPIATYPTQTSILGSVPPVATTVSVTSVVTTVSVPPVVTTVQVPPVVTSVSVPPVATTVQATSSAVTSVTTAPAAPTVVVKQPQLTKPYTGKLLGNLTKSISPIWLCVIGGRPGLRRLKIC